MNKCTLNALVMFLGLFIAALVLLALATTP
jgi:hypothetical protein